MTYRSMLVLLDDAPLCRPRVQYAIALARRFDAHLTGLAPTGLVELPGSLAAAASMAEFAQMAHEELTERAHALALGFDEACAAARLGGYRSVVLQSDVATGVLRQAHGHDLLILSQTDPASPAHATRQEVVERAVLFSARPTLLLPYAGTPADPLANVLVAWDGSREADRAIADALPLLLKAKRVHVISWREKGLMADDTPSGELDDLREWLSRHGVRAEVRGEPATAPIADTILSRTADLDIDLLVMGGYGHTRWTERLLGGATRGVLATMTVPVLMSR